MRAAAVPPGLKQHMTSTDAQVSTSKADWQREALCREAPHGFFPVEGEQPAERAQREEASRAVCRGCPVRQPCLQLALDLDVAEGIWGGLTAGERRALRRKRLLRTGGAHPPRATLDS